MARCLTCKKIIVSKRKGRKYCNKVCSNTYYNNKGRIKKIPEKYMTRDLEHCRLCNKKIMFRDELNNNICRVKNAEVDFIVHEKCFNETIV